MDSVTQAALGASIGEAMLGRRIGYKGAVLGAVVATVPDMDVILLPFYDSLQRISIHRGYSHSVLFSIVAAFLLLLLFKRFKWTRDLRSVRLWTFSWLALFTHMLLDAFTPYGTQLLLPFSDARISFDSITIVDPVYTLPLIIGITLSLSIYRNRPDRRKWANTIGLVISTLYLVFTLGHKTWISNTFNTSLQQQNIHYERLLTVPVTAANLKWYAVAHTGESLYLGSYTHFQKQQISFTEFPVQDNLLAGLDPNMVDRLQWFAKDYYTVAEHNGAIRMYNMQCDMQGIRQFGSYRAPTAWYFEIIPFPDGSYKLNTCMHKRDDKIN